MVCSIMPVRGRLVRKIPKEMGSSRSGSNCFLMARYISTKLMRIMTACCQDRAAKPDPASSCATTEIKFMEWFLL